MTEGCIKVSAWACHKSWWSLDHGVKINAEYYRENILEGALKPWASKHFGHRSWTIQQDSAPSHWTRAPRKVKKWGSSLHFHRTMATKICGCQSVGLLCPGYFGKQGWHSKIPKCRAPQQRDSRPMEQNTPEPLSDSVWQFHWPFEGHNSCQRWPIRTNLN